MTPKQACFHISDARRQLPHGIRPTDLHARIGRTIATWSNATPSHGEIARAVASTISTVKTALNRMRKLGILDWDQRFRGNRQLSNKYRFIASFSVEELVEKQPDLIKKVKVITRNLIPWPKSGYLIQPPIRTVAEQMEILLRTA